MTEERLKELDLEVELEKLRLESRKMDIDNLKNSTSAIGVIRWLIIGGIILSLSTTATSVGKGYIEVLKLRAGGVLTLQTLEEGEDNAKDSIKIGKQQRQAKVGYLCGEEDSSFWRQVEKPQDK